MVKRSKTIQNGSSMDRLSDLPDCMLHHILSFLDTRSSVQTSVLSKRWTSLWKYVHVLTFSDLDSERYVDQLLSLRSDRIMVARVTAEFRKNWWKLVGDRIVKYAASHGVQELYLCSNNISHGVFGSICACYRSLKVLHVKGIDIEKIDVGLWSRFQLLEALTLIFCDLLFADGATDAVANFPRLETLKIVNCRRVRTNHDDKSGTSVLKVTGPKLLHLEIVSSFFHSLEIVAPKLQSLTIKFDEHSSGQKKILIDVSKSYLPSLDRANINLCGYKPLFCVNWFEVLHNVQALTLKVDSFKTFNLAKHESSRFKRLKSVTVKCPASMSIPDNVSQYFLGGSPYEEDKSFTVKKLHRRRIIW